MSVKLPPKARKKAQQPQSEPEFLEAADDHEKAGGKWRAGDSAKAARFFTRALEVYDAGLLQFPASFDLAYNKALLQYEITEHPRIASQFGDEIGLLRQTLDSHRVALNLNPDCPDIMFSTAQVLLSLAEKSMWGDSQDTAGHINLVRESVMLFGACLARQETEYERSKEMARQADNRLQEEAVAAEKAQASTAPQQDDTLPHSSEGGGGWATVEEPITAITLLDTALAQLNAITMLIDLLTPESDITWSLNLSSARLLVEKKIPTYLSCIPPAVAEPPPVAGAASLSISAASTMFTAGAPDQTMSPLESAEKDARLGVANWNAALANTEYRNDVITISDYAARVDSAFAFVGAPGPERRAYRTVDDLSAFADALVELESAASVESEFQDTSCNVDLDKLRWTALSKAQALLKEASEPPRDNKNTGFVCLVRGDIDLKRSRLASSGNEPSIERARVLLSNAGVYYRRAAAVAKPTKPDGQWPGNISLESEIKGQVVLFATSLLEGTAPGPIQGLKEGGISSDCVRSVLGNMVEDGLLDSQTAESFLGAAGG